MNVTWDQPGYGGEQAIDAEEAVDDARLVVLTRDDPARFAALYERYADAVFGYALRQLRDLAADATARIFAQALAWPDLHQD